MFKRFFLSESNMLWAIVANAVVIFILYFPRFRHNEWLEYVDHIFIILFLIEAIVKISQMGFAKYFSSGWNRFDFLVVVGSLPTLLMHVLPLPDTSLLIVLRLFRLIRLARFITFIPGLSKVIVGLGRALKASVFVLLALFFLNFLLAIITCHFYGEVVPEYFGNPLMSAYSIFQLFTVEGWNEIPNAIADKTNNAVFVGFARFYFALVVLLGGVFGMSLANAVFVDEMTMDNNDEIEEKINLMHQEIRELKEMIKNK